ncbi:MAG: trypsin-like peptidase domain-containing protein [Ruminococcus sp.]|nr:trypsin-like peptidase domain-containing protein [Ruminococcus sp.]
MDYKPENDFYGNAPQKPFTEKNDYSQPAQRYVPQQQAFTPQPSNQPFEPPVPPQDFNPEKPLMPKEPQQNRTVEIPTVEMPQSEHFNPVQHTAVYQNGAFVTPEPPRFPQNAYGQPQPPYPPQGYYPQPVQQNIYARPEQQNVYAQPEQQNVYAQPKPPKQKSNKGLIAVIIVLSVLLAGSLAGILVYVLHNGSQQTAKNDDSVNGFHEFTLPDNGNGGGFFQQETTAPVVNDQSDYSDKIIPDYSGMKLEKKPSDAEKNTEYGSEYAFKSVSGSVVGIMGYSDKDKTQLKSQGSGIIISQGGYLITNAHVIGNSKTAYAISVITSDGKEYNAGVVGFDSRTDLAVLKMDDAENLKPATFGDSGDLTLGEDIIIVGNPGGISYQNSMTKGVVSALDRDASNKSIVKFIQTDAAINPGNSGGPAVNMYGQVIGVASSKIAGVVYEGMGFCIPTATVKEIVDSLVKNGYVEGRVKIGIVGTAVDLETATYNNVPQGIYVDQVDKDGPCGSTKLAEGDIVTALDGETITNFSEIYNVLEKHKDGDKVTLKYYQASTGKEVEEEITLAADK